MQDIIRAAAFAAGQDLAAQGHACKRSHLTETIAALLGYQTYAALVIEEADTSLEYHGEDAELYILNSSLADERAGSLGLPNEAVAACYRAFTVEARRPVFRDVEDFWDSHGREALEAAIGEGVMTADSNATFSDYPELEEGEEEGDIWTSKETWSIESSGTWTGEYHPDGDRVFNGNKIDVWGRLYYAKAGRAGLIFQESEEGGSPDDSWRGEGEEQF